MSFIGGTTLIAQNALVQPYLQNATPSSIYIMWETDSNDESIVEWGVTSALGNSATGTSVIGGGSSEIHTVQLTSLLPGMTYYYRARTGTWQSNIFSFRTLFLKADETSTLIVAMSDMQIDGGNPNKFMEIVHSGIMPYVDSVYGAPINETLDLIMIPGDLVENGNVWSQWRTDFFGQSFPLLSSVPVYPVPGNHENDAQQFFSYFTLPQNGTTGYEEHWWYKDYSNVRVIGMDSNVGYRIATQLNWLETVLTQSCGDTTIDFVFVQLHHPYKSELWLPGELDFTGEIVTALEDFTTNCGKPSIHFFGHTHGYSRGQSKDHQHLWVNVATAGGNIDYWGEYAQADYDEFVISQDEYGFVVVEVSAGDSARLVLKRISIGDEAVTKNNTLEDIVTLRKYNATPEVPIPLHPISGDTVSADCLMLKADDFMDSDDTEQGASQWQILTDSADFSTPLVDKWNQYMNWYQEINTQANDDLTDELIEGMAPDASYWWRVRYRDKGLGWSDWTTPVSFHTGPSTVSPNLLTNPGAEDGTAGWVVETGVLESLTASECNGISPFAGSRYFAIGALCEEYPFASAYQYVDVTTFADSIDEGIAFVEYGAMFSDWNGSDKPAMALQFIDSDGHTIGSSDTTSLNIPSWTVVSEEVAIPIDTREIRVIIMGTRFTGVDNDSYLDEIYCRVRTTESECSQYIPPGPANNRLYVDLTAEGVQTGESWEKAFHRVETALATADTALAIESIWVAQGVYKPTQGTDRTTSFQMNRPLTMYGGFNGTETILTQRDVSLNTTVLSGDIGIVDDASDNSHHVIRVSGATGLVSIDGFIIEDGMATDAPIPYGGGIFIEATNTGPVLITQCTVRLNDAQLGGAVFNQAATEFRNCLFESNSGQLGAHSLYNHSLTGVLTIYDVTVQSSCSNCGSEVLSTQGASVIGAGQIQILKNQ